MKNSLNIVSAIDDKSNNKLVIKFRPTGEVDPCFEKTIICKYEIDPQTYNLTFKASPEFVQDLLTLLNKNVEVSHEG